MEFDLDILEYLLRDTFAIRRKSWLDGKHPIRSVQLWDGIGEKADVLYLVTHPDCDRADTLRIGPDFEDTKGAWINCMSERVLPCCNAVLTAFSDFAAWRRVLELQAETDHDIREVIEHSAQFLKVQIDIVNRTFQNLTPIDNDNSRFRFEEVSDVQQLYLNNPDFEKTFQMRGLTIYEENTDKSVRLYYYNIFYREVYLARLLISVPRGTECPGLEELLTFLGKTVGACYTYFYDAKLTGAHAQRDYDLVNRLLDDANLTQREEEELMESLGWTRDGTLQVIFFLPTKNLDSETMLTYQCVCFEEAFDHSLCLAHGDGLCCLICFPDESARFQMRRQLSYLIREGLCRAGVSCTFHGISKVGMYARQARDALRVGAHANPSNWCCWFDDLSWAYILEKCAQDYPVEDLCHPALRMLEAYDKTHPDIELSQTLFQYLSCGCNATKTAQTLHIHRTTLLARMRRIQELAGLALESWEERMRLMVSYTLRSREV